MNHETPPSAAALGAALLKSLEIHAGAITPNRYRITFWRAIRSAAEEQIERLLDAATGDQKALHRGAPLPAELPRADTGRPECTTRPATPGEPATFATTAAPAVTPWTKPAAPPGFTPAGSYAIPTKPAEPPRGGAAPPPTRQTPPPAAPPAPRQDAKTAAPAAPPPPRPPETPRRPPEPAAAELWPHDERPGPQAATKKTRKPAEPRAKDRKPIEELDLTDAAWIRAYIARGNFPQREPYGQRARSMIETADGIMRQIEDMRSGTPGQIKSLANIRRGLERLH